MRCRLKATLTLLICLLAAACTSTPVPSTPLRILFVGSSLPYYNGVPAKFAALRSASRPGSTAHVEMLTAAGASLRDRIRDGSLEHDGVAQQYDAVVLQDFGVWPSCSTEIPACEAGTQSLRQAVLLAQRHGARPLWFATWQPSPRFQPALSAASAEVASEVDVAFADMAPCWMQSHTVSSACCRQMGTPTSAGSWMIAAALLRTLEPATRLPSDAVTACGRRWEGTNLRGDVLAFPQSSRAPTCERLDADGLRRIRAALSGLPGVHPRRPVAASEKPRA